jgi:hypothetical protein
VGGGVLLKDFAAHAEALTQWLREASGALARRTGRPIRYLQSSGTSKEAVAREVAISEGIEQGLLCILTVLELCNLSDWPIAHIEGLRRVLKGGTVIPADREAFTVIRSLPHGHVAAALGLPRLDD